MSPQAVGTLSLPLVQGQYRMNHHRRCGDCGVAIIEAVSIAYGCRTQRPNNIKIMSD